MIKFEEVKELIIEVLNKVVMMFDIYVLKVIILVCWWGWVVF